MTEITQALAMGKEVISHTDRISVPGWTGEGYVLFDPVTGDGAYKITGGSNGGFLAGLLLGNALLLFLFLAISPSVAALSALAGLGALIAIIGGFLVASILIMTLGDSQDFWNCFIAGFSIALALFGAGAAIGAVIIAQLLEVLGLIEAVSDAFNCTILGQ